MNDRPSICDLFERADQQRPIWRDWYEQLSELGFVPRAPLGKFSGEMSPDVKWLTRAIPFIPLFQREIDRVGRKLRSEKKSPSRKSMEFWHAGDTTFRRLPDATISEKLIFDHRFMPEDLLEFGYHFKEAGHDLFSKCLRWCKGLYRRGRRRNDLSDRALAALVHAVRICSAELRSKVAAGMCCDSGVDRTINNELQELIENTLKNTTDYNIVFLSDLPDKSGFEDFFKEGLRDEVLLVVMDPINGLRVFNRGLPLFSIVVGTAIWNGKTLRPLCGVVSNVAANELYVGVVDSGAVLIHELEPEVEELKLPGERGLDGSTFGIHLSTSKPNDTLQFAKRLLQKVGASAGRWIAVGSGSLAMAWVAAKRLDAYSTINTPPEGIFGAKIIVDAATEVGETGKGESLVTDLHGQEWTPTSSDVLVCANRDIQRSFLSAGLGR